MDTARICAKPQRSPFICLFALTRHKVDDLIGAFGVKLPGVGIRKAGNIAREFDHRGLHSEADAEIGQILLPRVFRGADHPLYASRTKTARNDNAVHIVQQLIGVVVVDLLRIDPLDLHLGIAVDSGVLERLRHRQIRVM